jgi:hypothetical protein
MSLERLFILDLCKIKSGNLLNVIDLLFFSHECWLYYSCRWALCTSAIIRSRDQYYSSLMTMGSFKEWVELAWDHSNPLDI